MKNLSKKLISVIMALLFALAPLSSVFAIKIPWLITYPSEKEIAETLGNFLKARDVDGIVGMFSESVKSELGDLEIQVKKLLDQIDCDIEEYTYSGTGGADERNYGYYRKSIGVSIEIVAEDKIFHIGASYIQAWTDDERKVGMRGLWLNLCDSNGRVVDYLATIGPSVKIDLTYKESKQCFMARNDWRHTHNRMGYNKLVITSSDESVAKVDSDGIVTAAGRGSARVTVTYVNETTGKELEYLYDVTVTFTRWQWIIWYVFFGFLWY